MNPPFQFPEFLSILAIVSTGTVALARLTTRLLQRSAAWRHFVWFLALSAPLVALLLGLPRTRINLPLLPSAIQQNIVSQAAARQTFVRPPSPEATPENTLFAPEWASARPPARARALRWPVTVWTSIWLLGASFIGLRFTLAHLRVNRLLWRVGTPAPENLRVRLGTVQRYYKFSRSIRLLVSPSTGVPFCYGIWHSTVSLPTRCTEWDEERVDFCLLHELAHIRRMDLLTMLFGQLACLLCWFNPLVWYAAARMRDEAEKSADDLVLAAKVPPAAYAASLIAITEECLASLSPTPGVVLAMARPHRLRSRIGAVLDSTCHRRSPRPAAVFGVSVAVLGVLTAAMTVRLTARAAEPEVSTGAPKQDLVALDNETSEAVWAQAHVAIKAGDLPALDALILRGLNVNTDFNGSTLLFDALDHQNAGLVRYLLSRGANPTQTTSVGLPLRRACLHGSKAIADMLIHAGAVPDELLYVAGMGDVAGLEARDKKQPITPEEAAIALPRFTVVSNHPEAFDWLWQKLAPLDKERREKIVDDAYYNVGLWGQIDMLYHMKERGLYTPERGKTVLGMAASFDYPNVKTYPAIVRYLLDEGAADTIPPKILGGMMRNAAGEGHLEIVRMLLDHGADINYQDQRHMSALGWAAYCGREDVCLLLIQRGADGNLTDDEGRNAAWMAAGSEHCPQALEAMLRKGVKVTGQNKGGDTVLRAMMLSIPPHPGEVAFRDRVYSAAEMREYDARERRVIKLLAGAGADFKGQEGSETPLMAALEFGHIAAARALVELGADLSAKDKDGNSAISYLTRAWPGTKQPLDLLEMYLQRGGDPNIAVNIPDATPPATGTLLSAIMVKTSKWDADVSGLREATRLLLDHGALFAGTDEQMQALLRAAAEGNLPLVQKAVRQGANVNVPSVDGWDALTVAVALDYQDCANWLLANGAEPAGRRVNPGHDVLKFAVLHDRADLVDALLAKGAKTSGSEISLAIAHKDLRMFTSLLAAGVDLKGSRAAMRDVDGKTYTISSSVPLYSCIERGQVAMANMLLDRGVDPDPMDLERGRSLMMWAVIYGQSQILQALLNHGADPLRKDQKGDTALSLAKESHPAIVPMLEAAIKRAQARGPAAADVGGTPVP